MLATASPPPGHLQLTQTYDQFWVLDPQKEN